MTKKQIMLKLSAYKVILAILVVALLAGVGLTVKARGYFDWGNVEDKVAASIVDGLNLEAPEEELGASTSDYNVRKLMDVNGDQTYHLQQAFQAGTTTLISMANPWGGVTSTVEFVGLTITGPATSSMVFLCGAAAGPASVPSVHLLGSGTVPTSTLGYIENNLTVARGAVITGSSTPKIMMSPDLPYFNCIATTVDADDNGAILQASRTLVGKGMVRFNKLK
jgi:hypothetical protein